jgi:hypothetical protein
MVVSLQRCMVAGCDVIHFFRRRRTLGDPPSIEADYKPERSIAVRQVLSIVL